MTDKELLQQALEWVEWFASDDHSVRPTSKARETAEAIKARLTQPEPKPVGCITEVHTKTAYGGTVGIEPQMYGRLPVGTLLYTAPSKKEWVGLTDEEILEEYRQSYGDDGNLTDVYFALAVEAKLKEKNHGNG